MITSAAFSDFNKDGWPDLAVAGEWMPLTIFMNNNGKFQKSELPGSSGLWQTIFVDDINKDGNPDILAGNWGWNTKYWSGKNGPLKLYVADFDKNGRTDQLLSYTLEGKEYPFRYDRRHELKTAIVYKPSSRFEASAIRRGMERFSDRMRNLYYDTVLYSPDALALLFKTVGADRCMFGTERPGVGTVIDPKTGKWLDETRHIIEGFEWLSAAEKKMIFEDTAKKVYKIDA